MPSSITVCVAEARVQVNLVHLARRAGVPRVPDEIEDALRRGALVLGRDNHLREVIWVVFEIGLALVLHVGLVPALWVNNARIALVVDNLVACFIFVMEWSDIEDATAKVAQLAEVVLHLQHAHLVQFFLLVRVRAENGRALVHIDVTPGSLQIRRWHEKTEDKAFFLVFGANVLVSRRLEVLLVREEEQVFIL